jgi:6-phosphogluconolactonase
LLLDLRLIEGYGFSHLDHLPIHLTTLGGYLSFEIQKMNIEALALTLLNRAMKQCFLGPLLGFLGLATGLIAATLLSAEASSSAALLLYVGTYTDGNSQGIYAFRMDSVTGTLTSLGLAAESENPSFLAIHPNRRFLYAANETGGPEADASGSVSAYLIDPTSGKLTFLNQQPSGGAHPCHLVVDGSGNNVLVANYTGGNVAVLPIGQDGRLDAASDLVQHQGSSVNRNRQAGPHAHGVYLDAANRFAVVADLGIDQLLVYRFEPTKGKLRPLDPSGLELKPGAGPRHFSFHPNGRHAYVINELDSTLTALAYDAARGKLTELKTVPTLPPDFSGRNSTAEVVIHPSGRFIYGSNRGADNIAIFRLLETGIPEVLGWEPTQGRTPRNFGIDPSGNYLVAANQGSDSLVVFRIDTATGKLTPTGETVQVGTPVCVVFLPAS